MEAVFIASAYVAGAIPFGYLIARARGVDIRTVGSGNIGATNVARACGKVWGLATLVLDAGKGFGPTFAALHYPLDAWFVALTGLVAFAGHLFPVFLGFRGGKGVATALGVFVAIAPLAAAIALGAYGAVYVATRISSLGSLTGATALLVTIAVMSSEAPFLVLAGLVVVAVFVRHRENIRRLLAHSEKRF